VLVALGLYLALPEEMAGGPGVAAAAHFAIPAVALVVLASLALGAPHRHAAESTGRRRAAFWAYGSALGREPACVTICVAFADA